MNRDILLLQETDSEVIVHFIHHHYKKTKNLLQALQEAVLHLEGAYALVILSKHHPDRLLAVRRGSPLVIGKGIGENFVASDVLALLPVAKEFIYLEDQDIAEVKRDGIQVYDAAGKSVQRKINFVDAQYDVTDRGEFRHYMRKEIAEQAQATVRCLEGRITGSKINEAAFGLALQRVLPEIKAIHLVACGTLAIMLP